MSTEAWIDVLQIKQERLLPGIRYVWDAPFFYVPIGSSLKYIQEALQDFAERSRSHPSPTPQKAKKRSFPLPT